MRIIKCEIYLVNLKRHKFSWDHIAHCWYGLFTLKLWTGFLRSVGPGRECSEWDCLLLYRNCRWVYNKSSLFAEKLPCILKHHNTTDFSTNLRDHCILWFGKWALHCTFYQGWHFEAGHYIKIMSFASSYHHQNACPQITRSSSNLKRRKTIG